MANWITPKTDWNEQDYFNIEDYNRIVGNILFVQDLATQLFGQLELKGMEKEKAYYSMFYAREMNIIEDNVEILNDGTYGFDIGQKQTYSDNQPTPHADEYNRIESACLRMFNAMYGQLSILPHLAFRLGQKNLGKRVKYAKVEPIGYRLGFRLGTSKGAKL